MNYIRLNLFRKFWRICIRSTQHITSYVLGRSWLLKVHRLRLIQTKPFIFYIVSRNNAATSDHRKQDKPRIFLSSKKL